MKKIFAFLILFTFAVPTFADTAMIEGWDELTPEQQAQIQLTAAQQAAAKNKAPVKAQDLQEWVELGKSLGAGFNSFAAELGKTVDELLKTTVGKIGMFLIVWHYIGDQFIGIIGGLIWFSIMLPSWTYYFRRWVMVPTYEWHDNGKRKSLTFEKSRSVEAIAYFTVALLIILVAGFAMIF